MRVLIVGGGIAGLSAGIALRRAGHQITILEKSSLHSETGAAIHLQPNATRVLLTWDFCPLRSQLVTAQRSIYADGATLKVFHQEDQRQIEKDFGAAFYFAHRVDLHSELKLLASRGEGFGAPIEILTGKEVVGYEPEYGTIVLADGTKMSSDMVVAAEGIHSKAVKYIVGHDNPARETGTSCFRFLMPSHEILDDEETNGLMEDHEGLFRFYNDGKGRILVWYPCRGNQVQNIAFIVPDHAGLVSKEGWNLDVDPDIMMEEMNTFHPSLQAMFRKVKEVKLWKLYSRPPLPKWHKSRLVMIGDAAHPMLPLQGQAGSQAIEDAAALGVLFSSFNAIDETSISKRLDNFENVRRNRASAMQLLSDTTVNHSDQEAIRKAVQPYMPGQTVPVTHPEQIRYRFSLDVLKDCELEIKKMAGVNED